MQSKDYLISTNHVCITQAKKQKIRCLEASWVPFPNSISLPQIGNHFLAFYIFIYVYMCVCNYICVLYICITKQYIWGFACLKGKWIHDAYIIRIISLELCFGDSFI